MSTGDISRDKSCGPSLKRSVFARYKVDDSVIFEVSVAPDDMGKIIGRRGRVARAIRSCTKAAAIREGKRVMVEIVE